MEFRFAITGTRRIERALPNATQAVEDGFLHCIGIIDQSFLQILDDIPTTHEFEVTSNRYQPDRMVIKSRFAASIKPQLGKVTNFV